MRFSDSGVQYIQMVSVIIPVYNRVSQALVAIQSVFAQSCRDFELIVVDDGSSIGMEEVCSAVEGGGGRYLRTENRGVAAARNFGVVHSEGEWLAFLDSDDSWFEDKLGSQLSFLERNSEFRICQTEELWFRHGRFVNPRKYHGKPHGDGFYRSLELCCISPSSVMLDRKLFVESGGFDERMSVCEDYDLWLRITVGHQVALLKRPLVRKYGGHADQLSRSQPAIDRFRVFSLVKLIRETPLSSEQRIAALREIVKKSSVLVEGAENRKNQYVTRLYGQIRKQATDALDAVEEEGMQGAFDDSFKSLLRDIQQESWEQSVNTEYAHLKREGQEH